MSAVEDGGSRLASTVVCGTDKRNSSLRPTAIHVSRTLLDIIRDEEPFALGHKDKRSWKVFRDRLRLKRAGAAWTSSIHIPTSDIPIHAGSRYNHSSGGIVTSGGSQRSSIMSKRSSVRFTTVSALNTGDATHLEDNTDTDASAPSSSASRPMITRRSSTRFVMGSSSSDMEEQDSVSEDINSERDMASGRSFRPKMSRHNSTRFPPAGSNLDADCEVDEEHERQGSRKLGFVLAEERALSAREAVAAQEAAEAEAARAAAEVGNNEERNGEESGSGSGRPVRMSLMDLLEETDRQMGVEGSRYITGEDFALEGGRVEDEEENNTRLELTCCVCMVRHKGSAFIPCGHTFCRLCSRELWVQRGNCPLCNGFILEILNIF